MNNPLRPLVTPRNTRRPPPRAASCRSRTRWWPTSAASPRWTASWRRCPGTRGGGTKPPRKGDAAAHLACGVPARLRTFESARFARPQMTVSDNALSDATAPTPSCTQPSPSALRRPGWSSSGVARSTRRCSMRSGRSSSGEEARAGTKGRASPPQACRCIHTMLAAPPWPRSIHPADPPPVAAPSRQPLPPSPSLPPSLPAARASATALSTRPRRTSGGCCSSARASAASASRSRGCEGRR